MLADARHVRNHEIGLGDLPQRAALVALLPGARLARTTAQASGQARLLLQPVARRRLGAVRTGKPHLPAKRRHLCLELGYASVLLRDHAVLHRYRAVLRSNQLLDFRRKIHPALDSDSSPTVFPDFLSKRVFNTPVAFRTHPGLGVNRPLHFRCNSLILLQLISEMERIPLTWRALRPSIRGSVGAVVVGRER